jgi:glycosyltransferase involved in cell wall biosynthesis
LTGGSLRIVVHDYSGHPFQVELSRTLAGRGHDVLHLYSAGFQTPKGPLARQPDDPTSFDVEGVDLGEPFQKYSYVRRLAQERHYGHLLVDRIATFAPDVVISANTPLDAQAVLLDWTESQGAAFVFWLQDLYSFPIERLLRMRLAAIGGLLARRFSRLEAGMLRRSDAVVAITRDFLPVLEGWRVPLERITVIENWAPLADVEVRPKSNAWSREHGLADVPVILYAGTLGLKHDPSLILDLAEQLPDTWVVVASEGLGADWLSEHAASQENLVLAPFQPFDRLSDVLGTADVLLAILEPEAGAYSVPSKILTSLCAGRAILASIPRSNLGARIVQEAGAGSVVEPGDREGFVNAAQGLIADPTRRAVAGRAARAYAEQAFDIEPITDRFEAVLRAAVEPTGD